MGELENKKVIVAEIAKKLQNSKSVIFCNYKGINVAQDTSLRKSFREADVEYKIYKNRLINKALQQLNYTGYDEKLLEGSTSVAFGKDEIGAASVLFKNIKNIPVLQAKFGFVNGEVADANKIEALSKIPSKDTLIAMLMGMLNAPASALVRALNEIAKKQA